MSDVAKKMTWVICALLLLLIAGGAVYYRSLEALPFAYGSLLGCGVNILRIFLLDRAVKKTVGMDPAQAANYVRLQYLLRFVLTGVVLVLAALVPLINIWGAAAGVLSYQVAALSLKRHAASESDNK